MTEPGYDAREIRKFGRTFALLAAVLAALPVLIGYLGRPEGQAYLPFHLSLDDHMVYAAWMRQAMDGQVLFDNRFTTDPQPGLTFHLLFLLLGWLAKVVGIPVTLTLARIGFSYLAVRLLAEFLVRCGLPSFTGKFALVLAVFGGGLAFLNWHTFGDAYTQGPGWLTGFLQGRQPIDNWQPEAFVFPSMLTNGLFMAALCLILWTLNCVMDARASWKPVLWGSLAFGVLMNVHSYDVALLAMVVGVFFVSLASSGQFEWRWTLRSVLIALGAVPAALWFLYVLREDPVFQSRAATLTYTEGFREIAFGILPMALLSLLALFRADLPAWRRAGGVLVVLALFVGLSLATGAPREGYALSTGGWTVALGGALLGTVLVARKDVGWNLLWSWAFVSLVAPYLPALFQRKLSMMLAVPWAILGAIALANELQRMERPRRNLVAAVALSVACLTSVLWLVRDIVLVRDLGVSKTAVHNLYLTPDETRVIGLLNERTDGEGVVAFPGVPTQNLDGPAFMTDLSPVLSGLTGLHSYAGHWSETPDYAARRGEVTRFFLNPLGREERLQILRDWRVEIVVAPTPTAYEGAFVDLSDLGEVVYEGDQLTVVRVRG